MTFKMYVGLIGFTIVKLTTLMITMDQTDQMEVGDSRKVTRFARFEA